MTSTVAFTYTETVTVVTRSVNGQDGYGNDVVTESTTDVGGCVVWPTSSTESVQAQDQVISDLTALLPPGTTVDPTAAVLYKGDRYEIVGSPDVFSSPFTDLDPGVEVNLKRVTG